MKLKQWWIKENFSEFLSKYNYSFQVQKFSLNNIHPKLLNFIYLTISCNIKLKRRSSSTEAESADVRHSHRKKGMKNYIKRLSNNRIKNEHTKVSFKTLYLSSQLLYYVTAIYPSPSRSFIKKFPNQVLIKSNDAWLNAIYIYSLLLLHFYK